VSELLKAIKLRPKISFLMVTNEVGWGIVPENGLARLYRDLLGIANQTMAQTAAEVWLSCSGIQIRLKPH
jgi:adenosylcobinamide kinase/adenosylcobinamide-phosphate guanylyltransferase